MSAQKAPKMNIIDRSSFWSDLGLGDSDNNSGNNNNNNSGNNSTTNNSSTDIDWASWLSGGGGDSSSAASMSGPSTPNNQIINGNQSPSKYSMNNNLNGMGNNGMGNNNNMRFNNNNNGMNNNNNNSGSSSDADWSNLASWLGDIGGGNGNNNSNNNNFDNMSIQSGGSWQSNNSGNMNNNMMNMNGNFNKGNGKKGNMNFNNKGNNGKNNNMGNNGKDSFWLSKDITNNQNLNGSNGGPGGSIDGFKLYKNEDFSSDLLNLYDDVTDEDVVEWISHYTLDTGAREKFWRIDSLDRRRIVGHGPISGDNSSASLMARVAQLNCRKRQVGQIGARYGSQYIGSGTRGNSIVGVTQPNGPGPGGPYHSDKNGKKGMKNGGNGGMINKGGKNNWNKDPWSIMDKGNNINGGNNWNNNGMNMNNNIMGNNNGMNNNMNNNGGDMNNWMNQNNGGKDNNMWGNNNNNNGGKWGNNMGKGNMNNNMNNNGGDWNNNNGNIMNNNGMNNMNNGKGDQWNNNNNFFGNNGNGKNQNNNMGKDNNGNFNNNMNQNNMGKGNNMDNNMNNNMSNNNNMNNNGNNNNGSGNGNGKDKVSYGAWLASQGPGQNQNTPDVNLGPSADIFGTPNDDMERCANDVPQFQRTGSVNLLSIQTDNLGNLGGSGINGTGTGSPKNTNGNNGGSPGTGKASERGSVDLSAKHADRITNLSNIETETNKLYENRFHAEAQALQNSNAVHNREQLLGIRVQSAFSVPYPVLAVESQHIPSQKEQQKALESGNLKEVLSVGKPVFLRINHLPEWITHSDQIKNYFSTVKTPSKKEGSGPGDNDNEEDINITDANDVVKKEETSKSGTGTDDTNATRTTSSNDLKVQASKNLKPMQGLQCISLNLEGRKVDIHFDSYANAVSAKGSKAGISLSKPVSNSSCASSSNSANNSSEEDGGPKKGSSTTSEAIAENLSGNKNNTDNTTDDSTNVVTTSEEFFIPQIEGPFRLPLFTRPISKESIAKRESINVSAPPGHHGAPSHLHMNLSGNTNLTEQFRNSSGTSSATKNSTNRRSRSPHRNQSSKSNRFSNLSPQSQKRKWLAVPEPRQEELVARNLMERGLFQGWTQKDVSSKVKEMFSEWRNNRMLQDSINTNGNGNSGSNPSSPNNTSGSKPVTYAAGGWNSSHYELNELLSVGFGGNVPSDSIDLKATAETTAEMINSILYGDDLTRDSTNANGNSAVTTTSSSDSINNNNNMGDTDMINANDKNSDDIMAAILGKAAGPGTEKTDNNGTGDNTNMESWDSWFNNILQ